MSRIQKLFTEKSNRVLNVYCTAGYPELNDTLPVIESLQESGVDLIELGIPYSDPLADGPVIQLSSMKAIHNGMTLKNLLDQLKDFRKRISIPVILMGYMNTILQYGFEDFCKECAAIGIA
jgi:tryptophan synthase alpha chain